MNSWNNSILSDKSIIRDAVELLEKSKFGTVFVLDGNSQLMGTITDGDIRRSIMKGSGLDVNILNTVNVNPIVVRKDYSKDEIKDILKDLSIKHIPVLDSDNRLIDVVGAPKFHENIYDNPIFLMAGGFGTRLRPLTQDIPKPMLHVGDKPILETIILEFKKQGFWNFYISIHYLHEKIKLHFLNGESLGVSIKYIYEEKPLGTAGALGLLPDSAKKMPLILMNGDLLTKANFEKILDLHNEKNCSATICVREYDFQVPFGVVESQKYKVKKIVEKPTHKFFVNAGIYVLSTDVVKNIVKNQELDMPDLLNFEIQKKNEVAIFPLHEYWLDIGRISEFNQAQEDVKGIFL
jgi:dTDP-glucose pyrophosphorylase